jgi:hypothetical protein
MYDGYVVYPLERINLPDYPDYGTVSVDDRQYLDRTIDTKKRLIESDDGEANWNIYWNLLVQLLCWMEQWKQVARDEMR